MTAIEIVVYPESLFIALFSAIELYLFITKEQFGYTNLWMHQKF